jgi:hypothetical protein
MILIPSHALKILDFGLLWIVDANHPLPSRLIRRTVGKPLVPFTRTILRMRYDEKFGSQRQQAITAH